MKFLAGLFSCLCAAQTFTQRGFFESTTFFYPQTVQGDSGRVVSEALFRYEAFYRPVAGLQFSASVDAQSDTHRQVERSLHLEWLDRSLRRPAFAVRRLSARYALGKLLLEAGKQNIRWGRADILNPTDRFAPKDSLNVAEIDFMPVAAARLTYGGQTNSFEVVWQPLFTPSRMPLVGQRWLPVPAGLTVYDLGARYPGGSNTGLRFNHTGPRAEFAFSFYEGHNHFPALDSRGVNTGIGFERLYPHMRMFGMDAAIPSRLVTVKFEAAGYASRSTYADEYALYVLQLERPSGEWNFTAGYAGEVVTRSRAPATFDLDRGLARAFLARGSYTIDPNRSVSMETAVRQNGKGVWIKGQYSQAVGSHWRVTAAVTWIEGQDSDFIGRYRRNSHAYLKLRYSF
jgi:hypothetical protein